MKKTGALIIFMFSVMLVNGQTNLVPNSGFENITFCQAGSGGIYGAIPWFQPVTWQGNTSNSSSSDLYDTCLDQFSFGIPTNLLGYQPSRTGHGYAGIAVHGDTFNYREYIEVPLLSTLLANKKYCVQFYLSLTDTSCEAISNVGAYFSNDSLLENYYHPITNVIPQIENPAINMLSDTVNWMLVSGEFIAAGGEKFMTIGNFHTPANTNSVNVAIPSSGGFIPSAYYYIDDVSVIYCDPSEVQEMGKGDINISPNPATNQFTIENFQLRIDVIHIYNVLGEEVLERIVNSEKAIDVSTWNAGVYFVEVETEKGIVRKKLVKQ